MQTNNACLKCKKSIGSDRKNKQYCSKSCALSAFRTGRYTTPEFVIIECLYCKAQVSLDRNRHRHKRQYCDVACSNKARAEKIASRRSGPEICGICKKTYKSRGIKRPNKYCSRDCYVEGKRKKFKDKHIALLEQGKLKNPRIIKRTLLSIGIPYYCSICEISSWREKPLVLVLDHIDGNSDNNKIENFRLVCPNCDSQSDFFKARNYGRGRTKLASLKLRDVA